MRVIEFEGIDGSGKTTAYTYFCDQLESKGFKVLRTREVGSPHIPVCAELRKLILNPETKMDGKAMEYVFAAMRLENQRYYASVKDQYDFIVSDRGWLSHLAYTDHNVDTAFTENFYLDIVEPQTKLPEVIVYMDIHPDVAAKRRTTRGEVADAIEIKGTAFQVNVEKSFNKYLDIYSKTVNVLKVNADNPLPHVRGQLDKIVTNLTGR